MSKKCKRAQMEKIAAMKQAQLHCEIQMLRDDHSDREAKELEQEIAEQEARVFDSGDLNRLTLEGSPGETVVVDVLRGGQQIQVYVLRGPIGIMGGGMGR